MTDYVFAVYAAVSTKGQAADEKESLPYQEERCRTVGLSKGWQDSGSTYIVPGESRTKWVNLRDAEAEIPQLHQMLEDGRTGKYNVLMLWDYNRLRDLIDSVSKTLASYGVQIYSVNQAVDPLPPEEFNPYASDSNSMMAGMSQIISRWQVSDLKRKFRFGMAARVRRGMYSTRLPYGYIKSPDGGAPVQVPSKLALVIEMKILFLQGIPYKAIARQLNEAGHRTPKGRMWEHTLIKQILLNPFYAGKVFFGRTKTQHDPNNNITRLLKNPNPQMADGKHKPIFTWEEHLAILQEAERREKTPRHHNKNAFGGLLVCGVCNTKLVCDKGLLHPVWRCRNSHVYLEVETSMAIVPRLLQKALYDIDPAEPLPTIAPPNVSAELERKKKRIQDAYESNLYTLEEAERRVKEIDEQIKNLKRDELQQQKRDAQQKAFTASLEEFRALLTDLPGWIREADPRTVNRILHMLIYRVVISPDLSAVLYLRNGS